MCQGKTLDLKRFHEVADRALKRNVRGVGNAIDMKNYFEIADRVLRASENRPKARLKPLGRGCRRKSTKSLTNASGCAEH